MSREKESVRQGGKKKTKHEGLNIPYACNNKLVMKRDQEISIGGTLTKGEFKSGELDEVFR